MDKDEKAMEQKDELKKVMEEIHELEERLRILKRRKLDLVDPPIEILNLNVRSTNALHMKGIERISQLLKYLEKDPKLERVRNIGKITADEIIKKLNK